jgi:hypothetical protein
MCHASRLTHRESERPSIVAIARAARRKQIDAHWQEQGRVIDDVVRSKIGVGERRARRVAQTINRKTNLGAAYAGFACAGLD